MRNVKICIFLFVVTQFAFANSQSEMEPNQTIESISLKTAEREISNKHLNEKFETILLHIGENRDHLRNIMINLFEDDRKKVGNMFRNSMKDLKREIKEFKIEMESSINKTQSDILKESEKLTSEINKVNLELTNVKLKIENIVNENKISDLKMDNLISDLNELKKQREIDSNYIVTELNNLKQLNKTKNAYGNNRYELIELVNEINSDNKNVSVNLNNKIDNEIKKVIAEVNKVTNQVQFTINNHSAILASELRDTIKVQSGNLLTEITELNYNKTNIKCENNINEFEEVKKIMVGLAAPAANCAELLLRGDKSSGIKLVSGINVVCDQDTDGGGWTVFQTRDDLPSRENFYRNWHDYSYGFGNLSGEFWLGLENIHKMTKYTNMELRIDLKDDKGEAKYIKYKSFSIENSKEKYRLNVGPAFGTTTEDALVYHNQHKFSTYDRDNDGTSNKNCAKERKGAWWYDNCAKSNLNGYQFIGIYTDAPPFRTHGISWGKSFGEIWNYSLRRTKMMFRPQ